MSLFGCEHRYRTNLLKSTQQQICYQCDRCGYEKWIAYSSHLKRVRAYNSLEKAIR